MSPISDTSTLLMTAILSMDVYNRDPIFGPAYVAERLGGIAVGSALGSTTFEATKYIAGTEFGATACLYGMRQRGDSTE